VRTDLVDDPRTGLSVEAIRRAFVRHLHFTQGRLGMMLPPRRSSCSARTWPTTWSTLGIWDRPRSCARAGSELDLDFDAICSSTRRSPVSATAASAGSPPATWTRWPRCRSRPSATASATSSASSTRRSSTAGRWSRATPGCATATPGRSRARRSPSPSASAATPNNTPTSTAPRACVAPRPVVNGVAYDTPIMGYGVGNVNLLRLWKVRGAGVVRLPGLQRGRLLRRRPGQDRGGDHLQGPLSQRRAEAGKELRLKQQYFFVSCSLQDMIRLQLGMPAPSTASTRSSPSSSTTPIPPSRSPSSCAS
jgi:hypothetical protein